ncbi:hypothetical protein MTP04_36690 [Lysinibacillus sp. PLM2]|nr:hypothetical protein MTP04_36690 [Lysinibacillus sp. PLM2]
MPSHDEGPNEPFNDATKHLNKIEGYPISKGGNLPLPIKIIGYIMFGGIFGGTALLILISLIIKIFN